MQTSISVANFHNISYNNPKFTECEVDTMLTKEDLLEKLSDGFLLLDGATGSNLQKAGMQKGCCTEEWVLNNPEALVNLQRRYAEAGSNIIYAPTFQAQPMALERVGLADRCEEVNARLVELSRSAAPDCLIAGDLTTLATFCDSWDEENFDLLVENYSRQIRGLIDGGADLLIGETLMYPQEAEAVLTAAELEGATCAMYSFTMQSDGSLFSGRDVGPVLQELEESGAAAVGFNCVSADMMTPHLVSKLRRYVKGPLICKPNAGVPLIGPDGIPAYPQSPEDFAAIVKACYHNGANLLGGCCGTAPEFIEAVKKAL